MTTAHVELSTRAYKDLRQLDPSARHRIEAFIEKRLRVIPRPANLDIRQLQGKAPWLRVRVGELRVVFRRLTAAELAAHGVSVPLGYLIVRVVQRGDLERAVSQL